MAYFQTLNVSDTQDMFSVLRAVNNISGFIFFPIMLLVIFFVWLLGSVFSGKPIYRAGVGAGFICSILSIFLVLMNFLAPTYMYFAFFITAASLIWTRLAEAYS